MTWAAFTAIAFVATVLLVGKVSLELLKVKASGEALRIEAAASKEVANQCLRDYVMGRAELPLFALGPWGSDGFDLWAYGDSMADVRRECAALLPTAETGGQS